jgi:hypothetical protein
LTVNQPEEITTKRSKPMTTEKRRNKQMMEMRLRRRQAVVPLEQEQRVTTIERDIANLQRAVDDLAERVNPRLTKEQWDKVEAEIRWVRRELNRIERRCRGPHPEDEAFAAFMRSGGPVCDAEAFATFKRTDWRKPDTGNVVQLR